MWYKIELDKDGSVKTCEHVEAAERNGKLVRYVEAESKAAACDEVKRWYERRLKRYRENDRRRRVKLKAAGQCIVCAQPAVNKSHCEFHRKASVECARRRRAGEAAPQSFTPEQAREAERRNGRRSNVRACKAQWSVLIKEFDTRGPKGFRAWMQRKADDAEARIKAEGL